LLVTSSESEKLKCFREPVDFYARVYARRRFAVQNLSSQRNATIGKIMIDSGKLGGRKGRKLS